MHWQRCLKATQLQNYVVDRKDVFPTLGVDDPSEESHVLTDKQFFYEVRINVLRGGFRCCTRFLL